jgi:hypothetical protein
LQQAGSHAPPIQSGYKFARSSDGKTRVDTGNMSVISDPAAAQTILLDHAKKTASIQPTPPPAPPAFAMPQMPHLSPPAMPAMPGVPAAPPVKVEDLGKSVMQGHEVEGKRFVMQPPELPKPPAVQVPGMPKPPGFQVPKVPGLQMPKVPAMQIPKVPAMQAPQVPGAPKPPALQPPGAPKPPQIPGMPPPPAAPPMPTTAEVWNSPKMALPMLTKMNGQFGQITQVCQRALPGEPHPSAFQIPPGYKVTGKS